MAQYLHRGDGPLLLSSTKVMAALCTFVLDVHITMYLTQQVFLSARGKVYATGAMVLTLIELEKAVGGKLASWQWRSLVVLCRSNNTPVDLCIRCTHYHVPPIEIFERLWQCSPSPWVMVLTFIELEGAVGATLASCQWPSLTILCQGKSMHRSL